MDLDNFNLAIADRHQLKFYAKEKLNLTLSLSMKEITMRQKIQDFCTEHDLEAPKAQIAGKGSLRNSEYATINVAKSAEKDGGAPFFVGVQGRGYMIPRGIDVDVPVPVLGVLENAVLDVVTQDEDTAEIMHEDVLQYPFNVIFDPRKQAAA